MLFNSLNFFIFFCIVLSLYFILPHRWQNRMLLIASYIFYGWWDWRFLSLIFISTMTDYICGIKIFNQHSQHDKRKFLFISVTVHLTMLGIFKYWDFFAESFMALLLSLGININIRTLNIILPAGISFYTFKSISYTVDIYRGEVEPAYNFFDYALFVSFFPQLVAGPIDRAKKLLPQILNKRHFDRKRMSQGLNLIFWGLFKKVFVADNLAVIVDKVYGNPQATGTEYIIATWAFAFQIYGDFSGYSDIARGTAKCLGIELMRNFNNPYFAISPSDFWRRWHISLSSWLRDYLYIPLGGNKKGTLKTLRNLFLTMFLGGLWHGAAWNFVIWGIYHGVLLCIYRIFGNGKLQNIQTFNLWTYMLKAFIMFQLTTIGWIFFRADSLDQIKLIFQQIVNSLWLTPEYIQMLPKVVFYSSFPFSVMAYHTIRELRPSWFSINKLLKYSQYSFQHLPLKSLIYGVLIYLMLLYGAKAQTFIYFQF